jgi:hypothetical protein
MATRFPPRRLMMMGDASEVGASAACSVWAELLCTLAGGPMAPWAGVALNVGGLKGFASI